MRFHKHITYKKKKRKSFEKKLRKKGKKISLFYLIAYKIWCFAY